MHPLISFYIVVMCVILICALQAGGPATSGYSDKSKSEVNDEDEGSVEVRAASPFLPTSTAVCFIDYLNRCLTD
jgi:hypothetical protein